MDKAALRIRRVTFSWRAVFVMYALVLTTATHWPRLDLGPSGPNDKLIHLFAFGLMPLLLWRSRWIARLGLVFLISLLWATLDEYSQSIEMLHRWATWQDLLANVLGITTMSLWIWAMRPVGGVGNRMRLALHNYIIEEIFSQWRAWAVLAGVFVACAVPLIALWPMLTPTGITGPFYLALIIWIFTTFLIWSGIRRAYYQSVLKHRDCFSCSESCADLFYDDFGRSRCANCGCDVHLAYWLESASPRLAVFLRLAIIPVVTSIVMLIAGFMLIAATALAYDKLISLGYGSPALPRLVRIIGTEKALMQAVDLAGLFMVFALATRHYRTKLARFYDQPYCCRKCGHDLRGTPTSAGAGRCGECGQHFARSPELAGAGYIEQ